MPRNGKDRASARLLGRRASGSGPLVGAALEARAPATDSQVPSGGGDQVPSGGGEPARGSIVFHLALADASHTEGTLAIYNEAIENTTSTFEMVPRTYAQQLEWITGHSGAYPAIVALGETGDVLGFGTLSPYRPRPAYSTTVEDSVYVHRDYRRLGVGKALLAQLLSLAAAHGFHAVIARISGENEASVALHSSCGFEVIGTEREVGRKFGKWLDVVCMERLL